jgi:hypothetical protein
MGRDPDHPWVDPWQSLSYTEVPPTAAMTDLIIKIITEVLSILAIATKEIKRGRSSEHDWYQQSALYLLSSEKFVHKLLGKNDIEDALKRLDTLTTEEARMATVENLKVTNRVDGKVDKVDSKVDKVDDKVDKVDDKVDKVDDKVEKVDNKVTVLIDGGKSVFFFGYLRVPESKHG